ncbi:MAG: OPT/YSL family transporter [Phycisphaerae bacterium]|nr:OPT/YSL family transporter [Phycisphaerae bacterium]
MNQPTLSADGRPVRYGAYPELTWPAVIVGWLIGSMLAVAIGYSALILGFSIEGNEVAAILGWGILRGIMRRSSIVENNINQTLAVSVNGASAGMMFTIPALFILAKRNPETYALATQYDQVLLVLACIAGGVLGIAFVIPLRKQMIDFNRLAYPGGIATAAILRSPGAGLQKAALLFGAMLFSAAVYFIIRFVFHVDEERLGPLGLVLGLPSYLNVTFLLSLMTVGVGFLSGKHGAVFTYGGFICYFLLAPLLAYFGAPEVQNTLRPVDAAIAASAPLDAEAAAKASAAVPGILQGKIFKPVGIGILIGAAIGGIIAAFPLVLSAIRSMQDAAKKRAAGGTAAADELPIWLLYLAVAGGLIVLMIVSKLSVPQMELWRAAALAVMGTGWIWVAGVIVSESLGRTNWSPLSGMTLIAITILVMVCVSIPPALTPVQTVVASIISGAAVCVAIAQAGGMMMDLKAGYIVGAQPRKQQIAQYLGTWLGPIIIAWLLVTLSKQGGGFGEGKLAAPQAAAMASTVESLVGSDAPVWRYSAGAGMGLLLALSGMGGIGVQIGLGFYLPFSTVLTYAVGVALRLIFDRFGHRFIENVGIPVAAGLVVGESLADVSMAIRAIATGAGGGH